MTEQDKVNELNIIKEKVRKLCDEHPHLGFFIIVNARDYGMGYRFSGNECPVCTAAVIVNWVESENIQHNGSISHNN